MTAGRIARYTVGAFVLWIVGLALGGVVFGGRVGDDVASRIGESLVAQATVGGSHLALVRGRIELDDLAVRKDDLGHLALDVAEIRCELPPLGHR